MTFLNITCVISRVFPQYQSQHRIIMKWGKNIWFIPSTVQILNLLRRRHRGRCRNRGRHWFWPSDDVVTKSIIFFVIFPRIDIWLHSDDNIVGPDGGPLPYAYTSTVPEREKRNCHKLCHIHLNCARKRAEIVLITLPPACYWNQNGTFLPGPASSVGVLLLWSSNLSSIPCTAKCF